MQKSAVWTAALLGAEKHNKCDKVFKFLSLCVLLVYWCRKCSQFTSQAGLGTGVVNQQSGEEAQDVFPVNLVGFQNLLQVTQQLLHTEDHSQLSQKHISAVCCIPDHHQR